MLSVIVVILVGICFTRLTMLALEMRDEDESNYGGTAPAETLLRKEILLTRMKAMKKPKSLVIVGEDQCKRPAEANLGDDPSVGDGEDPTRSSPEDEPDDTGSTTVDTDLPETEKKTKNLAVPGPEEIAIVVTPPMKVEGDQDLEGGDEIDVDPNDLCIICFERSKNAVFLECGHGGVCFSCAIDTCVVTGKCPLCRNSIEQIVTVAASGTVKWNGKNDEGLVESIAVIGPT